MEKQFGSWEPGDDICPPWWPFWWRRFIKWPPKPPIGFEKFEQLHLALTIHEFASQLEDAKLGDEIQKLTQKALRQHVELIGIVDPVIPITDLGKKVSDFFASKTPKVTRPMDKEKATQLQNSFAQEFLSIPQNKNYEVMQVRAAVLNYLRSSD